MAWLWLLPFSVFGQTSGTNPPAFTGRARVVIVHDAEATAAFVPRADTVLAMVNRALTNLTAKSSPSHAWRSLVSPQDTVGIKVVSAPGANSGTRPAVVAAVVEGLLKAKVPAKKIIVWDKHRADLRRAGFVELAGNYGIRVEGSADAGYDEKTFYENEFLGHLVWGDLEFGREGKGRGGLGRKSFVSKLVTQKLTKIISIAPLLNHNSASVSGHLHSLAMGSVDNSIRFDTDPVRLARAMPEIYALPALGDRVVLNITDALTCQYQGEQRSLLHYSAVLNELRFSTDPVALDVLSLLELERQRQAAQMAPDQMNWQIYRNATEVEIGVSDPANIRVERAQ